MAIHIAFLSGLALILYPFWSKKACVTKSKRVFTTIGVTMLCWWGIQVWLASAARDPTIQSQKMWGAVLHLKRVLSGVIIGLILGLLIQGDLFRSKKRCDKKTESKDVKG